MDPEAVLRQWQGLVSRDPRHIDHQLFTTLVDGKENRDIALTFRGNDATTVIDAIAKVGRLRIFLASTVAHICPRLSASKVLTGGQLADGPKFRALQLKRRLAGEMDPTNPPFNARKSKRERSQILPILLPKNSLNNVNQVPRVMRCRKCIAF